MTNHEFLKRVGAACDKETQAKAQELVNAVLAYKIAMRGVEHKLAVMRHLEEK